MDCVLANSKTLTNPNNFPEITEVYIRHWLNNLHVWHSTGKLLSNQEAFKPINKIIKERNMFLYRSVDVRSSVNFVYAVFCDQTS